MNEDETNMTDNFDITPEQELEALKERADRLGLKYHPSISAKTLSEKITAHMNEDADPVLQEPVKASAETDGARKQRLRDEARKLIRVNIVNMNPAKREWEGEIFTVGNSEVGTFKRFVPFGTTEGTHVESIILQQLRQRETQVFVNDKTKNGTTVRKGKLIKEFAIETLDPLTEQELKELARRQAMTQSKD